MQTQLRSNLIRLFTVEIARKTFNINIFSVKAIVESTFQTSIPKNMCCISVHFTRISTLLRNWAIDLSGSVLCLKDKQMIVNKLLLSTSKSY